MRLLQHSKFFFDLYKFGFSYPVPMTLNYFWNFGSLALFFLFIQICTGVFLGCYYVSDIFCAFYSVEYVMREVEFGWWIRYMHANGASFFFFFVYCHMFSNWFYSCYLSPRTGLWYSGFFIFLVMIFIAFVGYVLPWGQMSFWAATVMTSLLDSVPIIGSDLMNWFWGGFSLDNATLHRFYSLHYFLPFILLFLVLLHLFFLHEYRSSNPFEVICWGDSLYFFPYYVLKDLLGIMLVWIFFFLFICFLPNYLGHPDNYILANPLVTPTHIVPEWYFLAFYAILSSVPDKLTGVFFLFFFIIGLFEEFDDSDLCVYTLFFFSFHEVMVVLNAVSFIIFTWIGGMPVEWPYEFINDLAQLLVGFFDLCYVVGFETFSMYYEVYEDESHDEEI